MMWPGGRVGKCIINPVVVGCSLDDVGICTGTWLAKNEYPLGVSLLVVPTSDGAGTILAVGSRVRDFKPGDRVCPLNTPGHLSGKMNADKQVSTLEVLDDGLLREYVVYEDKILVHVPGNLSAVEASTLPCAALTAWNILYGSVDSYVKSGDIILTQGTGAVSMFIIQFATAAGATVIATTSSLTNRKAQSLKRLGVRHIIDYTTDANWGETAKSLTLNGLGVDHVVDVGGADTLEQSLKALRYEGTVYIVGFLSGLNDGMGPGLLSTLASAITARGILVGSKVQFDDMNRAIEQQDIKPVVDERIFSFAETREAYQYMIDRKHIGKVVIKVA